MKTLQIFALAVLCSLTVCAQPTSTNPINPPVSMPAIKDAPAAKPALEPLVIKAGMQLEIELAYTVSYAGMTAGEAISFRALSPLKVGDRTVIERGALATARVTKAEGGRLGWMMQHVIATDGTPVPLRYSAGTEGSGAPRAIVTDTVTPAGKRFEVLIERDTEISGKLVVPIAAIPARTDSHYTPASGTPRPAEPAQKSNVKKKKEWWVID